MNDFKQSRLLSLSLFKFTYAHKNLELTTLSNSVWGLYGTVTNFVNDY